MATLTLQYDDGSSNVWEFDDADQFDVGDSIWALMEKFGCHDPEPYSANGERWHN